MVKVLGMVVIAGFGALGAAAAADGQVDAPNVPPGAIPWHYECKGGDCPTKCTVNGNELFQTGGYASLTILQLPDRRHWIRVQTGQTNIDYVIQADQVWCTVTGATLTALPARGGENPPAPRPQ